MGSREEELEGAGRAGWVLGWTRRERKEAAGAASV